VEFIKQNPEKTHTIEGNFQWLQANNVTHTSYDAKIAPYAHFADGMIDLTFVHGKKKMGTIDMAKALINLEEGKHVNSEGMEYFKTKALIFEPLSKEGYIMMDGEVLEVSPLELQIHQALARLLVDPSLH